MDSIKTREFKSRTVVNAGDISSKTNTWPISNSVRNGPNLQSYLFQEYTSLNPSRVEQNYTIYLLKMAKTIHWTINVKFKLIFKIKIIIGVLFKLKRLTFPKQCQVFHFRIYLEFETLSRFQDRIHFQNLQNKSRETKIILWRLN